MKTYDNQNFTSNELINSIHSNNNVARTSQRRHNNADQLSPRQQISTVANSLLPSRDTHHYRPHCRFPSHMTLSALAATPSSQPLSPRLLKSSSGTAQGYHGCSIDHSRAQWCVISRRCATLRGTVDLSSAGERNELGSAESHSYRAALFRCTLGPPKSSYGARSAYIRVAGPVMKTRGEGASVFKGRGEENRRAARSRRPFLRSDTHTHAHDVFCATALDAAVSLHLSSERERARLRLRLYARLRPFFFHSRAPLLHEDARNYMRFATRAPTRIHANTCACVKCACSTNNLYLLMSTFVGNHSCGQMYSHVIKRNLYYRQRAQARGFLFRQISNL